MDSFLLLRRLVAAIVFKGQTVSDYWWSRRTIFLTQDPLKEVRQSAQEGRRQEESQQEDRVLFVLHLQGAQTSSP